MNISSVMTESGLAQGTAKDMNDSRDDVSKEELTEALSQMDLDKYELSPRRPTEFPRKARALYLNIVRILKAEIDAADLNYPEEFHTLLWMLVRLGGDINFIATDHNTSPKVVSRWVTGASTPTEEDMPIGRRRCIVLSALRSLEDAIQNRRVVPFQEYYGKRALKVSVPRPA